MQPWRALPLSSMPARCKALGACQCPSQEMMMAVLGDVLRAGAGAAWHDSAKATL